MHTVVDIHPLAGYGYIPSTGNGPREACAVPRIVLDDQSAIELDRSPVNGESPAAVSAQCGGPRAVARDHDRIERVGRAGDAPGDIARPGIRVSQRDRTRTRRGARGRL